MLIRILTVFIIIFLLFGLTLMVFAQDSETPPVIPAGYEGTFLLLSTIAASITVSVEAFKAYLKNPKLPYTPDEETRKFLAFAASIVLGLAAAFVTPGVLDFWKGSALEAYFWPQFIFTGLGLGFGGQALHALLSLRQFAQR